MTEVFIAVISGIIGGVIGPILFQCYSRWDRERHWAAPRKRLLKDLLKRSDFRSLDTLMRVSGTSEEDCKTLLIELGARGSLMADNREGWTLLPVGANAEKLSPSGKTLGKPE